MTNDGVVAMKTAATVTAIAIGYRTHRARTGIRPRRTGSSIT